MNSRIEQSIDEIEAYIDNCKFKTFSSDIILVSKPEIEDLLRELRMKTPEEIKRYQKIISNKEAILNDAKQKAQELLDAAAVQTNELISEHQIMQQAYAQANEIVEMATKQAQDILDNATIEANNVRSSAMQYTESLLADLDRIIKHTIETSTRDFHSAIETSTRDFNAAISRLKEIDNVVSTNRAQLAPAEEPVEEITEEEAIAEEETFDEVEE